MLRLVHACRRFFVAGLALRIGFSDKRRLMDGERSTWRVGFRERPLALRVVRPPAVREFRAAFGAVHVSRAAAVSGFAGDPQAW
jgi:hypothetical protein